MRVFCFYSLLRLSLELSLAFFLYMILNSSLKILVPKGDSSALLLLVILILNVMHKKNIEKYKWFNFQIEYFTIYKKKLRKLCFPN